MLPSKTLPSKTLAEEHVEMMLTIGSPFDQIEDYINETELRDYQKSALWKIAWSGRSALCNVELRTSR